VNRRRIAYPLALILIGVAIGISWTWGAPGTLNGATLLGIGVVGVALLVVALANREDEAPADPAPKRGAVVHFLTTDPVTAKRVGYEGDSAIVSDPHSHLVTETWTHTGRGWKRQDPAEFRL
jgi:hypothetical protein